jgi:hypothetical protein
MSVRKRNWKNKDGSQGEAWVVNYTDRTGKRFDPDDGGPLRPPVSTRR